MDLTFKHPFTCMVAGPTQAGKTAWVTKFMEECTQLMNPAPEEIYYAYTEWQPVYGRLPAHVQLSEGLPDISLLKSSPATPKLLILDDLMQEMKNDKRLTQLFTRGCHHWNLSCIHIVQNIFYEGLRTSRVNAQYLVLMKNPSDKLQAMNLGKQLYPGYQKFFIQVFNDATRQPYGYLLIDLHPRTEEDMRLRTSIFGGEQVVYIPKNL